MRLLHVLAPSHVGGLESVVRMLGRGLVRNGHEVHVAAILDAEPEAHPVIENLRAAGVDVHLLVLPGKAYFRERAEIRALCRRLMPAAVHTHGYRADVIAAAAARRSGVPVVTTLHGFTGGGWRNRLYERIQRRAVRRHAAVVAVSRPLAERMRHGGVPAERLVVIPNAWDQAAMPASLSRSTARELLGVRGDRAHIGWVGRLTAEKGADVLVEALANLHDLPVVASFVGDGPERAMLERRAASLGLNGKVRWHGLLPEMGRLFAALDVFVLSSRTEGTPIVLFEAMANGVPVVTTDVGGVPDVVSPTEALLVPSDEPRALAAAIRETLADRARAAGRAGAAARRLQHDFAVEPWIAKYEAVYDRVQARAS
ncbi:MAG TPA: glycosyltransferase family 4 protein [Gemmatimonadales bacterium]|nr:glycosyltransferase family 4 protein [Gemmatimonadales bacterium]